MTGGYFGNLISIFTARFDDNDKMNRFWSNVIQVVKKDDISDSYKIISDTGGYWVFTTDRYAACIWARDRWFTCIRVPAQAYEGNMKKAKEIRDNIRIRVSQRYHDL